MGALLAGARPESRADFARFGARLGLLFQIADDILDISVLRQVSVYGVIAIIYATLAGRADNDEENFWAKNKYYKQLFEKALQRCRVSIDIGGDGVSDSVRSGASVRLLRD